MDYKWYQKVQIWFIKLIAKIHWPTKARLDANVYESLREKLVDNYFIILTYRKNHLSSFGIVFAHWVLTGKWRRWSHALMNLEDDVKTDMDFRLAPVNKTLTPMERDLVESTGMGTHISTFDQVFAEVHAVALIKPKSMTLAEWTGALDDAKVFLGRPYDNLFNLSSDHEINCVELVRLVLSKRPNYSTNFANFEAMIQENNYLTPQMFYECEDFEVVYEVRV